MVVVLDWWLYNGFITFVLLLIMNLLFCDWWWRWFLGGFFFVGGGAGGFDNVDGGFWRWISRCWRW